MNKEQSVDELCNNNNIGKLTFVFRFGSSALAYWTATKANDDLHGTSSGQFTWDGDVVCGFELHNAYEYWTHWMKAHGGRKIA